ncbi:hypothetical protein BGZ83_008789 [Gryganskiella cystojenkinii]|nr:hypothetical protein BGZ83_008789 [Gryganskiella cystojenkinii]
MLVEADPQQALGGGQILDRDTYGGETPDATYSYKDNSQRDLSNPRPAARPSDAIDLDMQRLAGSMTLRELAGQMTQIEIGSLIGSDGELDLKMVHYWIDEWGVGSFLDTPTNHGGKYISYSASQLVNIVDAIQKVAIESGKKIPMIYGLDSVHGANYVDGAVLFPQQIGLAATFNTTTAYEAGRITARDTRAAGVPWVFAPILDIAVHKLWPRVYESFGEDPHVAATMGSAIIKGLQGDYKNDRTRVAACMKHFIGYSASRDGQDKSSAWIPDNYLLDYFVPSFQAAVDAGVATAMETYIDVNGQPVVGSHFYLTQLLRHRIGFEGMLVTDWAELNRLYTEHKTAQSLKDATLQSLSQTTVDMIMVPDSISFANDAFMLVQENKLNRTRLVESAAKVLQLKKDLGLFDQPMSDPSLLRQVGSQQDINAAKDAARESITLLKNDGGILPLNGNSRGKIFVTGPAADSIRALSGGWSIKWQGADNDEWYQGRGETILEGLRHEFGERAVTYTPSVDFEGNGDPSNGYYLSQARDADTVILCLGERPYAEIIGNLNSLDLPWGQLEVVRRITQQAKGTKTNVILVLVEGRPRGLQEVAGDVDAIVMAYLPGPWGGLPIAEVLSGTVNPSGRLPMTYPSGPADMATNYYRSGVDPYRPLFTFGAGLSYSTVEYRSLSLSSSRLHTTTYDQMGDEGTEETANDLADEDKDEEDNDNGEGKEGHEEDDKDYSLVNRDFSEERRKLIKVEWKKIEAIEDEDDLLPPPLSTSPTNQKDDQKDRHRHHHHHDDDPLQTTEESGEIREESGEVSEDHAGASIKAKVTVQNSDDSKAVKETVFWYITQEIRSDVMPEAFLLKGFEKVQLEPGQSKEVEFTIRRDALAYHGRNLRKKVEKGTFTLTVNAMRPEALSVKFQVV